MKRKISLFIAAVMALSTLPAMSVFARTSNNLPIYGGSVKDDYSWGDDITSVKNSPVLEIKAEDNVSLKVGSKFTVTLENAKWAYKDAEENMRGNTSDNVNFGGTATMFTSNASAEGSLMVTQSPLNTAVLGKYASDFGYTMDLTDVDEAEITITSVPATGAKDESLYIPLVIEVQDEGEVKATVNELSTSGVSYTTLTVAKGTSGSIAVSVKDNTNETATGKFTVPKIKIEETVGGKLDKDNGDYIELVAPTNWKWSSNQNTANLLLAGNFYAKPAIAGMTGNSSTKIMGTTMTPDDSGSSTVTTVKRISDTELRVYTNVVASSTGTGSITLENLMLEKDGTPEHGDLMARISVPGGDTQDYKIGVYGKKRVDFIIEDKAAPEIVSGVYTSSATADDNETLSVSIKEAVAKAWTVDGNDLILTLNSDDVKFRGAKVDKISGFNESTKQTVTLESYNGGTAMKSLGNSATITVEDDQVTISGLTRKNNSDEVELKLIFYVTAKPGYKGDIMIKTDEDNEAFASQLEAVVATAIDPITVTATPTPVSLGKMNIELNDVTIKENKAGVLKRPTETPIYTSVNSTTSAQTGSTGKGDDYKYLNFWIPTASEIGLNDETIAAEVIDGDIQIEDVDVKSYSKSGETGTNFDGDNGFQVEVKRKSSKPSEIKITGLQMETGRNQSTGTLDLRVGGSVTANFEGFNSNKVSGTSSNSYFEDRGNFDVSYLVAVKDYLEVGVDGEGNTLPGTGGVTVPTSPFTKEIAITANVKEIVVDGETKPTTAAPFIENNKTYIPVRVVAENFGLEVDWEPKTKTVTIFGAPTGTAQMQLDQTMITVDGKPVQLESGTKVIIRNNTTYLPFRALGYQVLGLTESQVEWDAATKTAYFNKKH